MNELPLRYGTNPHQKPARVFMKQGDLPIQVLNGAPGYINLLDALNSWQLVRELRAALDLPAATSFKHVSPAGAAVANPLSDTLRQVYSADGLDLSPLATAYARARGADRMSSFGDFVALSDPVDVSTARLLRREVSDGIIAPGYDPEALAILSKKGGGRYCVLQIDPTYQPALVEQRDLFGITFEQRRNDAVITTDLLQNVVTETKTLSEATARDLLITLITLKYTQSNSIALAIDGQIIGVGAGQQSRIHCTRLAASKAAIWWLRQHPTTLGLKFREGIGRPERDTAIDLYLGEPGSPAEEEAWQASFAETPRRLSADERREWLAALQGVALGSDAFIPFRDNIDFAHRIGVHALAQPGGSVRDDDVIGACNEYGMAMVFTGLRLFHH